MLLLLALLSVASAGPQFAYYIGGYPFHPYGAPVRHVYAPTVYTHPGPYIQPQAAEDTEETAVARSDFMGTFRSPEQQPRFLIDVRYAHTGLTGSGSGTLQAVVGLHQNFLVPNGGAYMTIKLVGVIPAMTSFLVAVLPAANTCALTAPASPADLDAFHTSAPFSLASMATAGTTATGEIVGVFTTGALPGLTIQTSALKFFNADGMGMFPAITGTGNSRIHDESVRLKVNTDFTKTFTASTTTVTSANYVTATGLKVMVWQLGTGGLATAPTAATLGCGTIMETPIAPII